MARIDLELVSDQNGRGESNVVGSVSVDGSTPSRFVGWVELLSLLERTLDAEPQQGGAPT